jgi:transcriptional regulator with XRE-family HTH domain
MSQENKLELPNRIRDYRKSIRLSQDELGERLGVSGNYISMIELGKKAPGPSLRKLFEALEQSPAYQPQPFPGTAMRPRLPRNYQSNPTLAILSTETLIKTLAEVADKLVHVDDITKKHVVGSLREYLDEIEHRLISASTSSAGLSEAQQIAAQAAKPGASH